MRRKFRVAVATVVLLGAWAFSACDHVTYFAGVNFAPPPPLVVGPVGPSPGPGFVWTDGYYTWGSNRWMWQQGRWSRPPRRGYVWRKPYYEPYHNGYRMHQGHWVHP